MSELIVPDQTRRNFSTNADPEQERIARYERRWKNRPPKARTTSLAEEGDHPLDLLSRYAETVGSVSQDFRTLILGQLAGLYSSIGMSEDAFMDAGLAFLHGLQPQDELEGALCVQLFGLHCVAMEMLKRSLLAKDTFGNEVPKQADACIGRGDRLLRAFRETLTALQKYRGKCSQQKVVVEHVHIHDGGQAVVGTINKTGGDRRDNQ